MKRFVFSLFLLSLLWFPLISYWEDCSVYDDLISAIDSQISNLKMRALNEYATRNNSSVNSYASYTETQITQAVYNSKYWDEMRSLMFEYDKAVKDKENCLSNSSSSSSSLYSDNSSALKYTATSSDGSKSMDVTELYKILVDAWFDEYDKKDYDEAINYFLQVDDLCARVKWYNSKMDESCKKTPKILSSMYLLAGGQSFKNKNYNEAKTFYTAWIKYDSKNVWLYVWLWNIAYIEWDYSWAIEYYLKWKKYETDQEKIKKIEKYISDCEKSLWNGNQNSEVAVDNLTTKLENMKEWETLEVSVQCDEWYIIDETQTKCVKDSLDQRKLNCTTWFWENSVLSKENNDDCVCKEWFTRNKERTSCVTLTESCVSYFWEHSVWDPTNLDNCLCESWYVFNSDKTKCVESNSIAATSYSNNYSTEYNNAYQFAFENKITTMSTIEEANMDFEIIRAEIAKMLANWVKSLGRIPDTSKSCNFGDIDWVKWDLHTAIIESCQLGIMWQWVSDFRPFDKITKWEVYTAVSRIIWNSVYDWWEPFYWKHMNALYNEWVISTMDNPETDEIRWNIMVILMNASSLGELNDCDKPEIILACSIGDESCPSICDNSVELVINITNWNEKIISDEDSKLDTLSIEAKNWDVEFNSIWLKFYWDYGQNNSKVWLTNGNRVISNIADISSDWYTKLVINWLYQNIKNNDSLRATIMIKTVLPEWGKIGYTIEEWTYSDNVVNSVIEWEPMIYKS